jgi:hypothetical protein
MHDSGRDRRLHGVLYSVRSGYRSPASKVASRCKVGRGGAGRGRDGVCEDVVGRRRFRCVTTDPNKEFYIINTTGCTQ